MYFSYFNLILDGLNRNLVLQRCWLASASQEPRKSIFLAEYKKIFGYVNKEKKERKKEKRGRRGNMMSAFI
jgi:hypothetical protein